MYVEVPQANHIGKSKKMPDYEMKEMYNSVQLFRE